jgi:hypothetical protein
MDWENQHFLHIAAETGSGIRIRERVERLLEEKARVGLTTGFMVLKKDGTPVKAIYFEEALMEKLEWIQKKLLILPPAPSPTGHYPPYPPG